MLKPSLVIVGNSTQGLGIIRSARPCGVPVYMLHDLNICSSRFSRYLTGFYKLSKNTIKNLASSPVNDELTTKLLSMPVEYPSVLLGINEDIINYFDANKNILKEKYKLFNNPYQIIFDKYEFNRLPDEKNSIPTFLYKDVKPDDFANKNFILKSRIGNKLRNYTGEKAIQLKNLNSKQKEIIDKYFQGNELIVQKIISSKQPVKSCCTFCVNGEIKGLFQYEKLRQHPNQFGTGTYLKSIYEDELLALSEVILKKLNYTGISEIEFILDEEDENYKAIEMNPRTWKSIDFATKCGQNLVEKYASYILGKDFNSSLEYKTNKYWVDVFTDIPQMFREKKLFNYEIKNLYECMWDKKDPLPFISTILLSPFILMSR